MKKQIMKSIAATLVFAIVLSVGAFAQKAPQQGTPPTPQERAERMTTKMTEKLGLNDYQADQIRPLNLELATQLQDIRQGDLAQEDKKAAAKAAHKDYDGQVKGLLTEEQYQKFAEARKRHMMKKKKKKGGQGQRPPKQRP